MIHSVSSQKAPSRFGSKSFQMRKALIHRQIGRGLTSSSLPPTRIFQRWHEG